MIAYKVVTVFYNKKLQVSHLRSANSPLSIKYYKSKSTFRPSFCGPLCVFKTLKDAESFRDVLFQEIWKCRIRKSKEKWIWYNRKLSYIHKDCLPKGTILADKVTLLEKM